MERPIEKAVNIGPVLAAELRTVGISSMEELHRVGWLDATRQLLSRAPGRDPLPLALALAGAIAGVRWTRLEAGERREVERRVEQLSE